MAMASSTHHLHLLTLSLLLLSLISLVTCDEKEGLLKGINNFRQSQNLSTLTKNYKATCFAKEIVKQLEGQPCSHVTDPNTVPGVPEILKKCKLNIKNTSDGLMLSVCVVNRIPNLVINNFTQTLYTKYLESSKFTGAGIGTEDDWTVIVLSTDTPAGSFSSSAYSLVSSCTFYYYLSVMLSTLFLNQS